MILVVVDIESSTGQKKTVNAKSIDQVPEQTTKAKIDVQLKLGSIS